MEHLIIEGLREHICVHLRRGPEGQLDDAVVMQLTHFVDTPLDMLGVATDGRAVAKVVHPHITSLVTTMIGFV